MGTFNTKTENTLNSIEKLMITVNKEQPKNKLGVDEKLSTQKLLKDMWQAFSTSNNCKKQIN